MRIKRTLTIAATLALVLALAFPALAETLYIKDTITIGLRGVPMDKTDAIGYLKTGDSFEVLTEEGDYLFVRTPKGVEGWIPKRYAVSHQPAAVKLAELRQQHELVQERLKQAEAEQEDLNTKLRSERQEAGQVQDELSKTRTEYNTLAEMSANVQAIVAERDVLREQVRKYRDETGIFSLLADTFMNRAFFMWFLAGGGVFLVGWLSGRSGRRQRY